MGLRNWGLGGGGEDKRMGNHGTSADSSSHAQSSCRLNESTEGAVTIKVESLFENFAVRVEKDDFLQKLGLEVRRLIGARQD